jgi:hypothetical protein
VALAKPTVLPLQERKPMDKLKQDTGSAKIKIKANFGKRGEVGTPPYSSRIIKAGALLPDTRVLFSVWDPKLSISENIHRIQHQNLLGKTSRSRTEDILVIFRQRYLTEESVARALAALVKRQSNGNTLDRIFYFHAARADSLLRDVVINLLVPKRAQGDMDVDVWEVEQTLRKWVDEGKTSRAWRDYTIHRVAQGLLSTLRDFGVLQGATKKRIAPIYLSVQAFSYIAFYLKQHQPSGAKLLDLVDWKLFFLSMEGVERFLLEAHQQGLLEYHVAGSVTRLTFPATTLEDYVNVIAQ